MSGEPEASSTAAHLHAVRDQRVLSRLITILSRESIVGIHIDTQGPDPLRDSLHTVYVATPGAVYAIDVASTRDLSPLLPVLTDRRRLKVFHEGKRTLSFLARHLRFSGPIGTLSPSIFDTYIASQLLNPREAEHTVQRLIASHLRKRPELHSGSGPVPDGRSSAPKGAADAAALLPLRHVLRRQLIEADMVRVGKLEFDLVPVLADMELAGVYINMDRWQDVWGPYRSRRAELAERLSRSLGSSVQQSLFGSSTFNPDSPQQTLEALRRLGLEVPHTGESLLRQYADRYPQVQTLLEYRAVAKLIDSCGDLFPKYIHPVTGRIHATYHQLGARTGRMSCSDPNIQQVPRHKEIRSCFQAAPGHVLVIADYSQVELRVAAALSGDRRMIEAYSKHQDLHRLTASLVASTPLHRVTSHERQAAKAVNFGLLYAMGAAGLARYAKAQYGVALTLEQAESFRHRFFSAYTGIRRWHDQARRLLSEARHRSVEVRSVAGRRYVFNSEDRLSALLNAPVQGSAADVMKRAMVRVHRALGPLHGRIIGMVHDELLVEVPAVAAEEAATIVRTQMEAAGADFFEGVPFVAEAQVQTAWA